MAAVPHVPTQGSTHFFLKHALFCVQSVFTKHSGRQPKYGSPWYSGKHVHIPSLHAEFAPQGDGLHGSNSATMSEKKYNYNI
jgi:hypothetical protein